MLKGYMLPRSPLGKASENPLPPWHYAGDFLAVEFWASPEAAAASLARGLTPVPKSHGHALALFVDWQFTAQDDELLDPARYQYREFYVLLDAMWRDTPVAWCPHIYVDKDSAMARGWVQGYPKKLGVVHQTRTFAVPGIAAAPISAGTRLGASLSVGGQRLAEARITLRGADPDAVKLFSRPTVNLRYFPRLSAGQHDKPAVHELVMGVTDNVHFVNAWSGDGELKLPPASGEELDALGPVRIGKGYRWTLSCSISDLRVLEQL
jgi:hypothetical protein